MFSRITKMMHYLSRRATPTLNWVEIRRDALCHNYGVFRRLVPAHNIIIPVLKSNAYGHGLREVSQIIAAIPDVEMIAVDNYPETQQVLHYTKLNVLMMGETHMSRYEYLDYRRVRVAVYTKQIVQELVQLGKPFCIHLFLNTGMNREGIQETDLVDILVMIRGSKLVVEGVMSHFACDDEEGREQECYDQIAAFKRMYGMIESYGHTPQYRHINNTSGIIKFRDPWFNAHRLGKGLYGFTSGGLNLTLNPSPTEREQILLKMVADVYSTVISTQQIKAGQGVGYGYQRVAHEEGQVITIPFGYAEGLTRAMAGQWSVRVGDPAQAGASLELPLVGAISMNYSSAWNAKNNNNKNDKENKKDILSTNPSTFGTSPYTLKGHQGQGRYEKEIQHGEMVHVISSNPEHANNRHEMARINHTITRELLIKMDEKMRRVVM